METGELADPPVTPPDLPPPPNRRRRLWLWVLSGLLLVLIAIPVIRVAVTYSNQDSDSPSLPVGVRGALGASDELSVHDQEIIVGLGPHAQRFNAAARRFLRKYEDATTTYNDPTTTYNERTATVLIWSFSADRHIKEMYAGATAMRSDILSIEADGLRETLLALSDTMRDMASALIELQFATETMSRNLTAELRALRTYQRASAQRQQLTIELLDRLRPYGGLAALREALQSATDQGTI